MFELSTLCVGRMQTVPRFFVRLVVAKPWWGLIALDDRVESGPARRTGSH